VLGLYVTCIIIFPSAVLLLYALHRMKKLRRLRLTAGVGRFITLSFEADADDGQSGELPPPP
jgi:hypothetical protein